MRDCQECHQLDLAHQEIETLENTIKDDYSPMMCSYMQVNRTINSRMDYKHFSVMMFEHGDVWSIAVSYMVDNLSENITRICDVASHMDIEKQTEIACDRIDKLAHR